MRISKIKKIDVANGDGIRVSIFISGCRHACKGCFNKDIWNFNVGNEYNEDMLTEILESLKPNYVKGLTLLGGEPLEIKNQEKVYEIIKKVKEVYPQKDIWCYTGFVYEYLIEVMKGKCPYLFKILDLVDVLVDGRFEIDKFDLKLKFRGSSNQRVIDMVKTRKENKIIWYLDELDGISKYIESSEIISKKMDKIIRKDIE